MRHLRLLFLTLFGTAALLGPTAANADGKKPGNPAANEIILHIDPYFGSGSGYAFQLDETMRQRVLYFHTPGQILRRNIRSVQVGQDVVATLYEASEHHPAAGHGRRMLTRSTTNVEPKYSIVVINRKSDGYKKNDYYDLPFRVSVSAQWSPALSAGRLHVEDFLVAQTPKHPTCHDLGPVLQKQGADDLMIFSGRYPTTHVQVTLHDQLGCRGNNARTFPNAPGYAGNYKLWDYGFGDKARSLRIRWKGPEFQPKLKGIPGYPVPPVSKPQFVVPDVKGFWTSQFGGQYTIGTNKAQFAWKLQGSKEVGRGIFLNATDVELRWTSDTGQKMGPIKGKVEHSGFVATRIVASNGVVLTRKASGPPAPAANLSGAWNSKFGRVVLQHGGNQITGMLSYTTGGTASIKGTIQGNVISFQWHAHVFANGSGTWNVSADRKTLAGSYTDKVAKSGGSWTLTR